MSENLQLNVNVGTSGAESSIGSLKKQLREAQNEVVALSDKFGATSQQAVIAAKKAAELRDRIGDAKALTDAFNPDAKFKALTSSLSGVAGGFGAVQGAMALFGAESTNVQKTLLKVQSAMALSQGLQAVGESIDSFKNLGTVIKTQVVTAFSTLRGAIIATGIGALVVGVGLLVANFEKVKETINNLFPALAGFADKVKNVFQAITDFIGLSSQAKRDVDALKKSTTEAIDILDNKIKVLQSQDGKEAEIYNAKKERINKQIALIKGSTDEEIKTKKSLQADLEVLDNQEANRIKKKNEDAQKLKEEKDKKDKEDRDKAAKDLAEFNRNRDDQIAEDEKALREDGIKLQKEADESDAAIEASATQAHIDAVQYKTKLTIDSNDAIKKSAEETKAIEIQSKQDTANAIADITSGLSNIIGQETAVGKAIAISSATIDTYLSASTIFKQAAKNPISIANPAYPYLMAAPAVLAGIARVKQISSVSVPKGGGAGGGMPSMSAQSPMMPQLPTASTTNISQQSINDIGNQAVRAYVIESDVTSNQQRIAAIRQRARFS